MMSLQKIEVFAVKRFSAMMSLLIANVIRHAIKIGMRNRKGTVTFLPRKPATNPSSLVDVIGRSRLNVADQIRRSNIRFKTKQNMRVIRSAVDRNQFLALSRNDPRNVFLELFAARGIDYACPTGDSEDNVEIDLRVGIRHSCRFLHGAPKRSSLVACCGSYKHVAPLALTHVSARRMFMPQCLHGLLHHLINQGSMGLKACFFATESAIIANARVLDRGRSERCTRFPVRAQFPISAEIFPYSCSAK